MGNRGRPPKEISRSEKYLLRLSENELNMLKELSEKYDVSMAEILRRALRAQYNLANFSD